MTKRKSFTPSFKPSFPDDKFWNNTPVGAPHKNAEENSDSRSERLLFIVVIIAVSAMIITVVSIVMLISTAHDSRVSDGNAASLRAIKLDVPYIGAFDAEMRKINPDYMCWITVEGTAIDNPVVRGENNEHYLDTSFYGEKNVFGTLFMDYRSKGEYVPHIIIYGHNSRHGDMFGGLDKFLDEQYKEAHPEITIIVNDRVVKYEIFSAIKTNVSHPAYELDFSNIGEFNSFAKKLGAPEGTTQIVTLSTCVSGVDKDERVIVQAALAQSQHTD